MADVDVRKIGTLRDDMINPTLVKAPRTSLVFATGDTVKSFTINANAFTHTMILEMPAFSGAVVTGTLSIENADSVELYSEAGLAENTDHIMFAKRPLVGDSTVKVTLSEDPVSDGTCYVTLYLTGE